MAEVSEDLEKLLTEVRKNISENRQFLDRLADEKIEIDSKEDSETVPDKEEFEEL